MNRRLRIFAAKISRHLISCFGLNPQRLLYIIPETVDCLLYLRDENGTLERRKQVAFYETPEGFLNGPVAVHGTVHCVTD